MNDKLKAILQIGEKVAVNLPIPGARLADDAGHAIFDKTKTPDQRIGAAIDAGEAGLQIVEDFKGINIANEPLFREGCEQVKQGYLKIHQALKTVN